MRACIEKVVARLPIHDEQLKVGTVKTQSVLCTWKSTGRSL